MARHPEPFAGPADRTGASVHASSPGLQGTTHSSDPSPRETLTLPEVCVGGINIPTSGSCVSGGVAPKQGTPSGSDPLLEQEELEHKESVSVAQGQQLVCCQAEAGARACRLPPRCSPSSPLGFPDQLSLTSLGESPGENPAFQFYLG